MFVLSSKPLFADRIRFLLCDVFFLGTAQTSDGINSSHIDLRPREMGGIAMDANGKNRDHSELEARVTAAAIVLSVVFGC